MTNSFSAKYGPWALVTGASRGLGAEFARQCAERGLNTVLVATNEDLLNAQADLIKREYGVQVKTVALDLTQEDILDAIVPITESLEIGLLVNNAGRARVRPFFEHTLGQLLEQFHVNARAGLVLAYHFGRKMAERRRGGIIFVSSASALCGTAYCANYAGTKAYYLIIGESLWHELSQYGVDVLALMPGPTSTPGWDVNQPKVSRSVKVMEARDTVAEGLAALGRGPSRIAGRWNRLAYFVVGRMLSRRRATRTVSKSVESIFGPFNATVHGER